MYTLTLKYKNVFSCFCLLICLTICSFLMSFKADGYKIDANITAPDGTVIYLKYEYNGNIIADSATVIDSKMILKGVLPEVLLCTLSNSVNQQSKVILLQNESIQVQGTIAKFYYSVITGASENMLFTTFKEKSINLNADYRKQLEKTNVDFYDRKSDVYLGFHRRIDSLTSAFVKANPDAVASSIAIINSHLNSSDFLKAEACYNLLSHHAREGYYAKKIKSFVDASNAVAIGKQASIVVLKDIAGNTFDLRNYRGKYILIDFWASWCKPCREEHPLLRELNERFKSKNILFVSISMESDQKNWRKAVADDQLTWTQLNDPMALKGPLAESYALKALPFNCVVDPQGKIIATKLRGDQLTRFLEGVFKDRQ